MVLLLSGALTGNIHGINFLMNACMFKFLRYYVVQKNVAVISHRVEIPGPA